MFSFLITLVEKNHCLSLENLIYCPSLEDKERNGSEVLSQCSTSSFYSSLSMDLSFIGCFTIDELIHQRLLSSCTEVHWMNLIEFSSVCFQVRLSRIIQRRLFIAKERWILKIYVKMERSTLLGLDTLISQINSIQIVREFSWVNFQINMTLNLWSPDSLEKYKMRAFELR